MCRMILGLLEVGMGLGMRSGLYFGSTFDTLFWVANELRYFGSGIGKSNASAKIAMSLFSAPIPEILASRCGCRLSPSSLYLSVTRHASIKAFRNEIAALLMKVPQNSLFEVVEEYSS